MTDSNHDLVRRFMRIAEAVLKRREREDLPRGYCESDQEYLLNNRFQAVELLDLAVEMMERRR